MTTTGPPDTATGDAIAAECAALVELHAAAVAADRRTGHETTARTIGASLDAHRAHDEACEAFRARHYPHAGKVVAVFGEVYVTSPGGVKVTKVYPVDQG